MKNLLATLLLLATVALVVDATCPFPSADDFCQAGGPAECTCSGTTLACNDANLAGYAEIKFCGDAATFVGSTVLAPDAIFRVGDLGGGAAFLFQMTHAVVDASGFQFDVTNGNGRTIQLRFTLPSATEVIVPARPLASGSDDVIDALWLQDCPSLQQIQGRIGQWPAGPSFMSLNILSNAALQSIAANFLRGYSGLGLLFIEANAATFQLPAGFLYGVTFYALNFPPPFLSYAVTLPTSSPSLVYGSQHDVCDNTCTSSCVGTTSGCCHPSCETCSGLTENDCVTCFASDTLAGAAPNKCVFSPTFNIAESDNTALEGTFAAGYVPDTFSCHVHLGGDEYQGGFALDNKFCCLRQGLISTGGTACTTGCAANAHSDFGHLVGASAENDKCWAICVEL